VARQHPSLQTWCLFKKSGMEGEVQEVVFSVQGVLTELQLPPLEKVPRYANLQYPVNCAHCA
jgi:hypothetical protein